MERGWYRGTPGDPSSAVRDPKRLARAENVTVAQTGLTALWTDMTGLSIDFVVTIYPVVVTLALPFIYGSTATTLMQGAISDSANTNMRYAIHSTGAINGGGGIYVDEIITVAGVYSRKGRFGLNSGGGNVNTFAAAEVPMFIEATEFRV